jgi:mannose-6-phosphate isomerase-like protein (cupin superfamily)|tara:strand:+ start:1209 stop:1673 length:465 start_codon:yes stop_codon:yes gene_type:complete
MHSPQRFIKNFDSLALDFNSFFEIMSENNYNSFLKTPNVRDEQILRNTFSVEDIHSHKFFFPLMEKIVKTYELKNVKLDGYVFVSFLQGNAGGAHSDEHDVLLYNLFGETMYIVDKEKFILETGDLLHIKKGQVHQAITIKPRITFSLGVKDIT